MDAHLSDGDDIFSPTDSKMSMAMLIRPHGWHPNFDKSQHHFCQLSKLVLP
jgi:hypothetical protein